MTVEIRETIVMPGSGGVSVQLHISDVPKDAEGATFRLVLLATLPQPKTQILEGLQMDAIRQAQTILGNLRDALYRQVPDRAQSFLRD
jgi:hypothetical protein